MGQPGGQLKLRGSITKEDGENGSWGKWPSPSPGVSCNHRTSGQNSKVKRVLEMGDPEKELVQMHTSQGQNKAGIEVS